MTRRWEWPKLLILRRRDIVSGSFGYGLSSRPRTHSPYGGEKQSGQDSPSHYRGDEEISPRNLRRAIRQELEKEGLEPSEQTHLDRRKRDLKKWFVIEKEVATILVNGTSSRVTLYRYGGARSKVVDEGQVSLKERAEIIHAAHGRCQMCGRSVEKDRVALVVDHKKPRDWDGTNDRDNLWAICEECNAGKKAYFSSLRVDAEIMKRVTAHNSVHVRIGELLKAVGVGRRISSQLIEVVADQDDWQKRLRELRYPVIGWKIDTKLYRAKSGKKLCDYILRSFESWPNDPSGVIRRFEEERKKRNLAIEP